MDSRPLGWAASRALRELKMGGKWPGPGPLGFPPITSRGVFSTPCAIWRRQQPPSAQRNRPFFSSGAPAGHGGRQGGAPRRSAAARRPTRSDAPASAPPFHRRAPGRQSSPRAAWPQHLGNEARTEEAPVRRLQKEEKEVLPRPPDRRATRRGEQGRGRRRSRVGRGSVRAHPPSGLAWRSRCWDPRPIHRESTRFEEN